MDSTISTSPPAQGAYWPASLHGVGFVVLASGDGTYEVLTEDGYAAFGFASTQAALVAVTDWIEAHTSQGGNS